MEAIKIAENPKLQKSLGGAIVSNENWEREKFNTMFDICSHKFNQNKHLMDFLMETKETYLVEDNPNCDVWGLGISRNHPDSQHARDLPGNQMGKILMQIRKAHQDLISGNQESA
jgi:hypothetical protein